MRRYLFPLLVGVIGCLILVRLGVWQLDRLEWKEALLDRIQAQIDSPPTALPAKVNPTMKYQPVLISGRTTGEELLALSGTHEGGGGYQVISGFDLKDGRRIMVDRGFILQDDRRAPRPPVDLRIVGNLHWPDEITSSTPEPNLEEGIWFARDVPRMAKFLHSEPILVVAAGVEGDRQGVEPMPIGISGIPNNHQQYAITWFLLAIAWAGMTIALAWRIKQRKF